MFIDASALTAILADEADASQLAGRMQRGRSLTISPIVVWETVVAVGRIRGVRVAAARQVVVDYIHQAEIHVAAVPPEATAIALEAFERFGKGQHPARLSMGDCFAYPCARHLGEPLLFKGSDFSLTDIEPA